MKQLEKKSKFSKQEFFFFLHYLFSIHVIIGLLFEQLKIMNFMTGLIYQDFYIKIWLQLFLWFNAFYWKTSIIRKVKTELSSKSIHHFIWSWKGKFFLKNGFFLYSKILEITLCCLIFGINFLTFEIYEIYQFTDYNKLQLKNIYKLFSLLLRFH